MTSEEIPQASATELIKEALLDVRELVRVEVELARSEVDKDLASMKRAAAGFVVALVALSATLSLVGVAVVIALGGTVLAAVGVAAFFALVAATAAYLGYAAIPKKPMEETRARLVNDAQLVKEHAP